MMSLMIKADIPSLEGLSALKDLLSVKSPALCIRYLFYGKGLIN